jgi:hypothetical protein
LTNRLRSVAVINHQGAPVQIVSVDVDGVVLVRKIGDGKTMPIDAAEARRIARLPVGTMVEYDLRFERETKTSRAISARPLESGVTLQRPPHRDTADVARPR